ncbi:FG-nucleoporin NUP42 Ecym_4169 [Eremothecium cymbalariae DBVPG|uniref:C3H1-type domain-containing protein n=1 Tax=Eremothecium cymbalariae (strain CBS 270.75 / DBVPG 7215 / KCTC 17166 / NRRL Y-17582) TaxID=931890 RepID=G8JT93_ERECY|nr:hypothetical protein Ecym_4169 [Eremothecium cymbalariae DBVPG\
MSYNRNQQPCKYFQQGRCNKGKACNFAHVYSNNQNNSSQTAMGKSEAERYKDLVNDSSLDKWSNLVTNDMIDVNSFRIKPLMSSYSVSDVAAVNLIQGRDYSAEESRFQHWMAKQQNNLSHYEAELNARDEDMKKCIKFVKDNAKKGSRFLQLATRRLKEQGSYPTKGFIEHPLDLTGKSYGITSNTFQAANTFGAFGGTPSPSPFGQLSTATGNLSASIGTTGGSFGQPSFGQTSLPATGGVFGQPSFGSSNVMAGATGGVGLGSSEVSSAFGKPAFGNQTTSGVIASANNRFSSSKPNAFGQPTFGSSGFGATTKPASTFGPINTTSSPFGSFSNNSSTSPFGQFSNNSSTSPFGQFSNTTAASVTSPFGSSATQFRHGAIPNSTNVSSAGINQNNSGSPFGTNQANPFQNQTTGVQSPFNQPTSFSAGNAFGFGQNGMTSNLFNKTSGANLPASHFEQKPPDPFNGIKNVFNSSSNQPVSTSSATSFVQGLPTADDKITEDDLPTEILNEFRADKFTLRNVPDAPPPLTLVS